MPPDERSEQEIRDENEALKQELRLLGRDPARFDDLLSHEANLRLKSSLAYAEQAREAELLGQEPPPSFLDPMSSHWIPDVEDMVHYRVTDLLGKDAVLPEAEELSDEELEVRLHWIIDRLAATVPVKLASNCPTAKPATTWRRTTTLQSPRRRSRHARWVKRASCFAGGVTGGALIRT